MEFRITGMRRLRRSERLRWLVRERHLRPGALIYPLFLVPGEGIRKPISSMPGVFNLSIDEALKEAAECAALGIGGPIFFGVPSDKDEQASGAYAAHGLTHQRPRAMKADPSPRDLVMTADTCLAA